MIKQADRRVNNIVVRLLEETKISDEELYEHILTCIVGSNERCEDPSAFKSKSVKKKKESVKNGNT